MGTPVSFLRSGLGQSISLLIFLTAGSDSQTPNVSDAWRFAFHAGCATLEAAVESRLYCPRLGIALRDETPILLDG